MRPGPAWRNQARCIGRLYWRSLRVRDCRAVTNLVGMYAALCEHLELGTGEGDIWQVMTVFAPAERGRTGLVVCNRQLASDAGYRECGTVLGDPLNCALTEEAFALGSEPCELRTAYSGAKCGGATLSCRSVLPEHRSSYGERGVRPFLYAGESRGEERVGRMGLDCAAPRRGRDAGISPDNVRSAPANRDYAAPAIGSESGSRRFAGKISPRVRRRLGFIAQAEVEKLEAARLGPCGRRLCWGGL